MRFCTSAISDKALIARFLQTRHKQSYDRQTDIRWSVCLFAKKHVLVTFNTKVHNTEIDKHVLNSYSIFSDAHCYIHNGVVALKSGSSLCLISCLHGKNWLGLNSS